MLANWRESVLGIIPHVRLDAWILRQDSAPTRDTFSVWKLMANNKTIPELYQSPYSPYLVRCDFWLFPKQKTDLKSHRFQALLIIRDIIQGDQKVSVHLMITIREDTSNVQSIPRQSPDIY